MGEVGCNMCECVSTYTCIHVTQMCYTNMWGTLTCLCIYGSYVPHVYIVYMCVSVSLCTHDVHMFAYIFQGGYIYVYMYICTHALSRCIYMLTC